MLDCTTQQGTHYAVLVNCDGRAVLQTNLTASQASNLASILMVSNRNGAIFNFINLLMTFVIHNIYVLC